MKHEVYSNEVVLVGITPLNDDTTEFLTKVLQQVETYFRGKLKAVIAVLEGDIGSAITLYYRGEEVLRQTSFVGDLSKDVKLIEWSIREILSSYNR
ncbi:MAG: hypothetical protein J7L55_03060 [Desulfurococcales archaeon]|nr:hypothetical protein [Desulfurococcales archaeon]